MFGFVMFVNCAAWATATLGTIQILEQMRGLLTRVDDVKRLQTEFLTLMEREIGPRPNGRLCSLTTNFKNLKGAGQRVDEIVREFGFAGKIWVVGTPVSGDVEDPVRCCASCS